MRSLQARLHRDATRGRILAQAQGVGGQHFSLRQVVGPCRSARGLEQRLAEVAVRALQRELGCRFGSHGAVALGKRADKSQVRGGQVTHGTLRSIDRYSGTGGKICSSFADTSHNLKANGIVANVVESPQLGLQFNASVNNNSSVLNVMRNRLSVGGRTDDSDGRAMVPKRVFTFIAVASGIRRPQGEAEAS